VNDTQGTKTQEQAIQDAALNPIDDTVSDYVPCEFTTAQLLQLRAAPESALLTDSDSESLKTSVINAARSSGDSKPLAQAVADLFISTIAIENFTGLTQTQALAVIVSDYSEISSLRIPPEIIKRAGDEAVAAFKTNVAHALGRYNPAASTSSSSNFSRIIARFEADTTNNFDLIQELRIESKVQKAPVGGNAAVSSPGESNRGVAENSTVDASASAQALTDIQDLGGGQSDIVDAARSQSANLLRPKDVFCSMSILSFKETRSAYGSLVADNYIAVQVAVRNLNEKYEFQIHDAELAVDSDPSGRHGRFFSGSDRRIVRSFAVAQQSFDTRNLTVNTAQAVGALLSTISPIFGGSLADAVGVLTGAAIPGLGKVWKDQSTDQLNLLNDTALAPGTGGTSVPRHGVTIFVMFVPSIFYDEGWWTLECANKTYLATGRDGAFIPFGQRPGQVGLDFDKILEPCIGNPQTGVGQSPPLESYKNEPRGGAGTKTVEEEDVFAGAMPGNSKPWPKNARTLPFKRWPGSTLAIFRELSFVTVSGVHTVEESELQSSASKLSCTPDFDAKGNVTFNGIDPIVCVLSGQNLGTITKLRLRNASDPSDLLDVAMNPTSGDPSSGTVKFNAAELAKLKGAAYNVLIVDKKDTETKTSVAMHFLTTLNPVKITPDSLNMDTVDQKVTIVGSHLDAVTSVKLARNDKTGQTVTIPITKPEADTFSFSIPDLDAAKLGDLSAATKIDVTVSTTGEADSKQLSITVTKTLPAAKPKPEPAPGTTKGAAGGTAKGKGGKTGKPNAGTPVVKPQ
jgi:hypothetical protein